MNQKKKKTLVFSTVLIVLCLLLIIGGTYAIWTSSVEVNNHFSSGSLKAELYRTSYNKSSLTNEGVLENVSNSTKVLLNNESLVSNIFGIEDGEKVVPGSTFETELEINNNGDVRFTYNVYILLTSVSNDLAEQMHVYVKTDDVYEDKGYLNSLIDGDRAIISTQYLNVGSSEKFSIKVVFDDVVLNNNAQNQEVDFDLYVKAYQSTN